MMQKRQARERTGGVGFVLALLMSGCAQGEKCEPCAPVPPSSEAEDERSGAERAATGKSAPTKSGEISGSLTLVTPAKVQGAEDESRSLSLADLAKRFPVQKVDTTDPNYNEQKSFLALPLRAILLAELEEKETEEKLRAATFLLQASDGYAVRASGEVLLHPSVFLALGEEKVGAFEPIGDQKVQAGPLYMIWEGASFTDQKKYPRPWALVRIEMLDTDRFSDTRPAGGFAENKLAEAGYELFSQDCLRCHSINQQGGKLGPDLNVPQNILAYRPEPQVRAYIKSPRSFRYGAMPEHPDLTEKDLDALIAYLRLMGENQKDPNPVKKTATKAVTKAETKGTSNTPLKVEDGR